MPKREGETWVGDAEGAFETAVRDARGGGVLQTIVGLFNEGTAFQAEVSGGHSYYPDLEVVYVSPRSTNNRNV